MNYLAMVNDTVNILEVAKTCWSYFYFFLKNRELWRMQSSFT